jgi:hypothetical protein
VPAGLGRPGGRIGAPRPGLVELVGAAHMTPQTHPKEVAALLHSLYD